MDLSSARALFAAHAVHTVKIGGPDLDGAYRGKRIPAAIFLDCFEQGFAQCDVIFGWDIAEELVPGLRFTGWESGYPDIIAVPDLETLAVVPWEPGVASVICDGLDGVEARFTHTNTTRGSFTDVFCDVAVVGLVVAGLAWAGLIHPALAVLFVYSYTALAIFLVLHRLLAVSSAGILRPSRMVFFAAVALYFFLRIDLLNILLLLYLPALPLLCLSFWRVRKAL